MRTQPHSMKDVAQKAGVSVMTVSRALRAHAEISEPTRQRILRIAKQLNYRPDAHLSELMAYIRRKEPAAFTGTLAILRGCARTGDDVPHYITNETQIKSAHEHAMPLGYKIDEFIFPFDGKQDRRLTTILKTRNITGLIIYPPPEPGSTLRFDFSEFCPVVYSTNLKSPKLNRVVGNTPHAVHVSLEKLSQLGFRRIGLAIYNVTDTNTDHAFLPSYLVHQHLTPEADRIPPLVYNDIEERGYHQFMQWVDRWKPEAIISHDTLALQWLRRTKIKVPNEISYVNLSQNPNDPLPTAGISENPREMGRLLVDVVLTLLRAKEVGLPMVPRDSYAQATWNDGPTVVKRPLSD